MFKKSVSVLLTVFMLISLFVPAFAEWRGDMSCEVVLNDITLGGNGNYQLNPTPLLGVTELRFGFDSVSVPKNGTLAVNINGKNIKTSDNEVCLANVGLTADNFTVNGKEYSFPDELSIVKAKAYELRILVNTSNNTVSVSVLSGSDMLYSKSNLLLLLPRSEIIGLQSVDVEDTLGVNLKALKILRNSYAPDEACVHFFENSIVTVGALAVNDSDETKTVNCRNVLFSANNEIKEIVSGPMILNPYERKYYERTYYFPNATEGDKLKTFIWSENDLMPYTNMDEFKTTKNTELSTSIVNLKLVGNIDFENNGSMPDKFYKYPSGISQDLVGITSSERSDGSYSYFINADSRTPGGYVRVSNLHEEGFIVELDIKLSSDLKKAYPYVSVNFSGESGYLSRVYRRFPQIEDDKWHRVSIPISPADYPAGATYANVIFILQNNDGASSSSGKAYIDNVIVKRAAFININDDHEGVYSLGDTVTYKTGNSAFSSALEAIECVVKDSDNNVIFTETIPKKTFLSDGFSFTPDEAGYYRIRFNAVYSKDHAKVPETRGYSSINSKAEANGTWFNDPDHRLAVINANSSSADNNYYGISSSPSRSMMISSSARTGFGAMRYHMLEWYKAEPSKGQYNFEQFDKYINQIKQAGMKTAVTIWGTPKWASPSDDESLNFISQPIYAAYVPTNVKDFQDFLTELIRRYGDMIDEYEVWNEPDYIGRSVFLKDSTENFAAMFKAASQTIREKDPTAKVRLEGVTERYLTSLLELGLGDYFDSIGMHGKSIDTRQFRDILKSYGVSDKEIINSEAHFGLITRTGDGNLSEFYRTEDENAFKIMSYYLKALKFGVEGVNVFTSAALVEADEMTWIADNDGWSDSVGSIYRTRPQKEPNLEAQTIGTLIANSGAGITYVDEYINGDIKLVEFNRKDGKKLFVFWTDEPEGAELTDEIISIINEGADITDWTGKPVSVVQKLRHKKMYYLECNNSTNISCLEAYKDKFLVTSYDTMDSKKIGPLGTATDGELFSKTDGTITNEGIVWNSFTQKSNTSATDAEFAISELSDGIDLLVKVHNKSHYTSSLGSENYNCLYIDFDTMGENDTKDCTGFLATTKSAGTTVQLKKLYNADSNGYLPPNLTAEGADALAVNTNNKMFAEFGTDYMMYKIHFDYSDLFPMYSNSRSVSLQLKLHDSASGTYYDTMWYTPTSDSNNKYDRKYPSQYGVVKFTEEENVYNINGITDADANVSILIRDSEDKICFADQIKSDSNGKYQLRVGLPCAGDYKLTVTVNGKVSKTDIKVN